MAEATESHRRSELINVRLTEPERRHLELGAAEAGCTLSELVRVGARRVASEALGRRVTLDAIGEAALAEEKA